MSSRSRLFTLARKLLSAESGATAIEYAMICAFVVLAIVGSIQLLGNNTTRMYNNVAAAFPAR